MKIIFCCLLIFNIAIADAHVDKTVEGSIVLSNGEVLVGKLLLHLDHDVILFSQGNLRMVYAAHKVKAVYYYDSVTDINRRFVSLKQRAGARTVHRFFEVVLSGDVKVLRLEKNGTIAQFKEMPDYHYFVYQNETLIPLRNFRREVYPRLNAKTGFRLDKVVIENRLTRAYPIYEIYVIEHYNKLLKPDAPIARH